MNKQRRAKIEAEVLAAQTAIEALRFALQNLQDLATEEQDCFDNMPEGLQASENGQRIEEIAQAFESANSTFESAIDDVESAIEEIGEAVNQ
jgi:formiminotetrahydrofolate cyclodeaminase